MLNNLKISQKLLLLLALPMLGLIYYASISVMSAQSEVNSLDVIAQKIVPFNRLAADMVHELQKERGMSAGFIGSGGTNFADKLPQQRQLADKAAQALKKHIAAHSERGAFFNVAEMDAAIGHIMQFISSMADMRQKIDGLKVNVGATVGFYSNGIAEVRETPGTLAKLLAHADQYEGTGIIANADLTLMMEAYAQYTGIKEAAGIERAVLSNVFAKGAFAAGQYDKWQALLNAQNIAETSFKKMAEDGDWQKYQRIVQGDAIAQVEAMRQQAAAKAGTGNLGVSAEAWFAAASARINLLRQAETELLNTIEDDTMLAMGEAQSQRNMAMAVALVLAIGAILLSLLISRGLSGAVEQAVRAIVHVAEGKLDEKIPHVGKDEVGQILMALGKMRDALLAIEEERKRAGEEREQERKRQQQAIRTAQNKLADDFEQVVGASVSALAASAEEMNVSSDQMRRVANDLDTQSQASATGVKQGAAHVQLTAAATEQMSATIAEVTHRLHDAMNISAKGVTEAKHANDIMKRLDHVSSDIGNVVNTINEIAEQTNLLALNASIEAARAGDAGRGFAVVANEVKDLAQQTAKATGEIEQQITDMQKESNAAVAAINNVFNIIENINEHTTTVASAMEEQTTAVREIAHGAQQASQGMDNVETSIKRVSSCSDETSRMSEQMVVFATDLASQSEQQRAAVYQFLNSIRS